jgi:hypothetical protein
MYVFLTSIQLDDVSIPISDELEAEKMKERKRINARNSR